MRSAAFFLMLLAAGCGGDDAQSSGAQPNEDAGASPDGDASAGTPDGGSAHDASTSDAVGDALDAADAPAVNHDGGAPRKIVAGYYPNWTPSPVRLRDVDAHYNLIYLFAATPVGGAPGTTGAVEWSAPGDGRGAATHLNEDIAYARATQGRKIVLSIGGAGNGMSFPTRAKSQAFLDSVVALYASFGGIDGIDWNTFEGSQAPDTSEMIWISQQLKARYPGFLITAPPAPWNAVDKTFCDQMVRAGALDYCAPQYYDGPGLAVPSYVEMNVGEWVTLLGEDHVVVGFGVWDQPNYMTIDQAIETWKSVAASHPGLHGAFDWQIDVDEASGWSFGTRVGPLVAP
jgi:hypothetical protein